MKSLKCKSIKISVILPHILFFIFCMVPTSEGAFFDFNDLPYPGHSSVIEEYMESAYGSDITVFNAIVGNGIVPGPLGPDHYIQSDLSTENDIFSISFESTPIISASFEWGSTANSFIALADGVEIFDTGYVLYNSGFFSIDFATPVYTLTFHDHGLGKVSIDNLTITAVPIPGTLILISFGLLGLKRIRNRSKIT